MTKLSIVIVNYNVKEFLLNLLQSLRRSLENIDSEIIVVDNASTDGAGQAIKESYPEVIFIQNKKNLGFGAANNIGLEEARGEFILLINPDTIVKEDTLSLMLDFFEKNPEAGMAGCKVLNPDGSLQLPCRRGFPGPWTSFCKVTGLSKIFPKSKLFAKYNLTYLNEDATYEVDAISGAFMMFRRKVYEKVGGFDSAFFMYGEDLDLCYRTQKAGFKIFYVHSTQIIHYKGESAKRSSIDETKLFYDAMSIFVKKHFSSYIIVEAILRAAIILRGFAAFINIHKHGLITAIFDFIFFSLSIFTAAELYFGINFQGFPDYAYPQVYLIPALLHVCISFVWRVYKKDSVSILKSLIASITGFFILSSATFFFKEYAFSRALVLITYSIFIFTSVIWRIIYKIIFKLGIQDKCAKKIRSVIIGDDKNASSIARKMKTRLSSYYNVLGLISESSGRIGEFVDGVEIIGSEENIKRTIIENKINEVVFSTSGLKYESIFEIVSRCQGMNVEFKMAGSDKDFIIGKSAVLLIDESPFMNLTYNISWPSYRFAKTVFDKLLSFLIIISLYFPALILSRIFKVKLRMFDFILITPRVFSGALSFVGPKSENKNIKLYLGKPGITGLWFIENYEANNSEELLKLDIFYAKNQSIWFDLEIIGKTIGKLLFEEKNNE